ncbi:MAG: ATP-grasp domain-containing protein, partial [Bacilli bacterium]
IYNLSDLSLSNAPYFIERKRFSSCSRGIRILTRNETKELKIFYSKNYILQEYIDGSMYVVDVLCDKNGIIKMIIPRKEISIKDGTTFKCEIVKHDLIVKYTKKIYKYFSVPGISNIQFIEDKNGNIYFIELNSRVAATMIASSLSSINILDLYIENILFNKNLPCYSVLMKTVKWNTIISRYYEETVFKGK